MAKYRDAWAQFDPEATGYIEATKFADLMLKFGPPLGWDESFRDKHVKQVLFFKLIRQNMKTYHNHTLIQFSDVLDAITLFYIIKTEVRSEMEEQGIEFLSENEDEDSGEEANGDDSDLAAKDSKNNDDSEDDSSSSSDESGGDGKLKPTVKIEGQDGIEHDGN